MKLFIFAYDAVYLFLKCLFFEVKFLSTLSFLYKREKFSELKEMDSHTESSMILAIYYCLALRAIEKKSMDNNSFFKHIFMFMSSHASNLLHIQHLYVCFFFFKY